MEKLKLGVVGLGGRGFGLTQMFLKMPQVEVVALCDLYEDRVQRAADKAVEMGKPAPFGTLDYKEVITKDRIDCVVVATSWRAHTEVVLYAMKQGVPVGTEVGGANCIEDCFEMVRVWEETKTPYMFCENCSYGEKELMVLNMVKKGLFGDIVHCEGGYCHDLRSEVACGRENRHYRLGEYLAYNRENYPTHELLPLMSVLDINHGNRFTTLSSFSSKAAGINEWAKTHKPEMVDTKFAQGDVVTTVLTTSEGQTVVLSLDTTLPRSYSRRFTVRGTKGMYMEDNDSIFFDTDDKTLHSALGWRSHWGNANEYLAEHSHPIWANLTEEDRAAGHGGMDYLCYSDFFNHVLDGKPMPLDIYDGATVMAVSPLSEMSIKLGGAPVNFPDFKGNK